MSMILIKLKAATSAASWSFLKSYFLSDMKVGRPFEARLQTADEEYTIISVPMLDDLIVTGFCWFDLLVPISMAQMFK